MYAKAQLSKAVAFLRSDFDFSAVDCTKHAFDCCNFIALLLTSEPDQLKTEVRSGHDVSNVKFAADSRRAALSIDFQSRTN